ncbi:MAG: hypothetical protein AB1646_06220 [Thermodesulfobacteriota bacterium]
MPRDDDFYDTFQFDEDVVDRSSQAQRQDSPRTPAADHAEPVRKGTPLDSHRDARESRSHGYSFEESLYEDSPISGSTRPRASAAHGLRSGDSAHEEEDAESTPSLDEGTGEQLIRALQRFVAAQQRRLRHSENEIGRLAQDNSRLISLESWFRQQMSDRAQDEAKRARELREYDERIKQKEREAHSLTLANKTLQDSRKKFADENTQLKADKDALEAQVSNLAAELASRDGRIRELEETARTLREGPRVELLERVRAAFPNAGIADLLTDLDDRTLHITADALLYCLPKAGTPLDINALTAISRQLLSNLRDTVFPSRGQVLDFAADYFSQLAQTHKFKNVEGQQYSANVHQTTDAGAAVRPNQKVKTMLSFLVVRDKTVWSKASVILES